MTTTILPGDLLDALAKRQLDLFVGSGCSKASGLPTWDNLVSEMRTRIQEENTSYSQSELSDFLDSADHLDIAEVFKDMMGDHTYYNFLRRHYRSDAKLSRLHHVLKTLPITTIFTTNYDRLLERCFCGPNGIGAPSIVYPEQLGYFSDIETRVIKLHGDIDHPGSIVLTRSDYTQYASRHLEFVQSLQHHVTNRSLLFVGFSLRDSNFQRIYKDARSLFGSTQRRAYAIMKGVNPVESTLWEKEYLKILPIQKYGQVGTVLRKLRDFSKVRC